MNLVNANIYLIALSILLLYILTFLTSPTAVLKLSAGDSDAIAVKVSLLIDLGNAAEALQLIDATPSLATSLAYERAYCTYRLGRLQDALAALATVGSDRSSARLQLEAQVQYRLGNYTECVDLYSRLFKEHADTEGSPEIQTNVVAAHAVGGKASEIPSLMSALRITPQVSFEIGFNAACGLLEEGNLAAAEEALHLAKRVGEEQLYEDEMEEDEVETELTPIAGQLAYLGARQGKLSEAVEALREVVDSGDQTVGAAAAIDLAAVLLRQRPGDRKAAAEGLKALESYVERSGGYLRVKSGLEGRLGISHSEALLSSYASAAIGANKLDIAREALRSIDKAHKGSASAALLQAALLARDGKVKEAAAALDEMSTTLAGSAAALAAHLARVQLAAAGGDTARAAALLAELPKEELSRPAVVATRVALLEQSGDLDGAATVMRAALQSAGDNAVAARWALRRLAALDIKRGDLEGAAIELQKLAANDPASLEDPELLSMLPRLVAACNPEAASDLAKRLPAAPVLPPSEIDSLEAAGASQRRGPAEVETAAAVVPGLKRKAGDADGEKKKKKRKKRIRLPKGFDPENPGPLPDPERWLPKWQRAEAKKARKKRKDKDITKGSQGAGKVDASLDKSGPAAAEAAAAAAPAATGKSGKKKGKGRR